MTFWGVTSYILYKKLAGQYAPSRPNKVLPLKIIVKNLVSVTIIVTVMIAVVAERWYSIITVLWKYLLLYKARHINLIDLKTFMTRTTDDAVLFLHYVLCYLNLIIFFSFLLFRLLLMAKGVGRWILYNLWMLTFLFLLHERKTMTETLVLI